MYINGRAVTGVCELQRQDGPSPCSFPLAGSLTLLLTTSAFFSQVPRCPSEGSSENEEKCRLVKKEIKLQRREEAWKAQCGFWRYKDRKPDLFSQFYKAFIGEEVRGGAQTDTCVVTAHPAMGEYSLPLGRGPYIF